MREFEDFSDYRLKTRCLHCGHSLTKIESNLDHVPTKSLLTKGVRSKGLAYDRGEGDEFDYLPQVVVCKDCNTGFAKDETYLLCVMHAIMSGSLYPDPKDHPEASAILRSNRQFVRALKHRPDGQLELFDNLQPFTLYPETDRIRNVVIKNARGHAYHELGEPKYDEPERCTFFPIQSLNPDQRLNFENITDFGTLGLWPEVGSRMTSHLLSCETMSGGWISVEQGRYRYALDWAGGVTVKSVIWEYLATETYWEY